MSVMEKSSQNGIHPFLILAVAARSTPTNSHQECLANNQNALTFELYRDFVLHLKPSTTSDMLPLVNPLFFLHIVHKTVFSVVVSINSLDPCLWGESNHPAFGPPDQSGQQLHHSSEVCPQIQGDSVVCM